MIRQFEDTVRLESAQETAKSVPTPSSPRQHTNFLPAQAQARTNDTSSEETSWDPMVLAVRVNVLEEQLTANARDAASEISRLKMRILELETSDQQRHDVSASGK